MENMIDLAIKTLNKDSKKRNVAIKNFLDRVLDYYENGTEDEKEFYADELDEAIHWDALAAAYDDF